MIDVVGHKRILFIGLLLALNILLAAGTYYYLAPKTVQTERQLNNTKAQAGGKRSEIQVLRDEFKLLQQRIQKFRQLELSGFFETQNRLNAVEKVDAFREKVGLLKAKIDVKPGEIKDEPRLNQIGYAYLESPISFELEALDDLEIYMFMKMVEDRFNGKTVLESFEIEKIADITATNLGTIADGVPTPLVKGSVSYKWITLPEEGRLSP